MFLITELLWDFSCANTETWLNSFVIQFLFLSAFVCQVSLWPSTLQTTVMVTAMYAMDRTEVTPGKQDVSFSELNTYMEN